MPVCRLCLKVQPTVEVRRTRLGHVCKDKWACNNRQSDLQERGRAIVAAGANVTVTYSCEDAYDLNDPKHPRFYDAAADWADMERKRDKGE